ncbi:MAG: AraC family transcriptional regulator [Eubacteriales bacterium]|nr:AraC family transcriptional regulator [Eubacteriales bacterium]
MIQNLNKFTFAPFGEILPDSDATGAFPDAPEWTRERVSFSQDEVWVYRVDGMPTYLEIESGTAALAVSREGEALEYFYLDQPVRLHAGILFAVVPRETCSIHRAIHPDGAWVKRYPLEANTLPLYIRNRLEVRAIYTLFYQEKERGFLFKGESHDLIELVYVDKGELHNVVDGADTLLSQGEMMLYAPGIWHMQYADLDVEPSFITVSFDLTGDVPEHLFNRRIPLGAESAALLRRMLDEREKNAKYSGELILCSLQMLLLSVLQSGEKQEAKLKTPASLHSENTIVNAALSFVSAHITEKLSVPYLAKRCNVSASRLTALFQQRLSITPADYIRRVKLEESKLLIRAGEMNVSQIAAHLNYSSVQQFSRQFKTKFGVSPNEFAKSIR